MRGQRDRAAPRAELSPTALAETWELAREYAHVLGDPDIRDLSSGVLEAARQLPLELRAALDEFRTTEPVVGHCIISGWPVRQAELGATPSHWRTVRATQELRVQQSFLLLIGSLLGATKRWDTQQDGRLVHHVMPMREHENEQLGTGSSQQLWWHTEDAFHPHRPDFVLLLCLRNPTQVPTIVGSMAHVRLSKAQLARLFEPHFTIRPDESHQPRFRGEHSTASDSDYAEILAMRERPDPIAVLYGDPATPYLRLDPYFMDPVPDDEAQRALNELITQIDATARHLVLQPGELCILDNRRVVHGRRAFCASYTGYDRWLMRLLVTRTRDGSEPHAAGEDSPRRSA